MANDNANYYKITSHRPVLDVAPGEEGELELSEEQERDWLARGWIEISPRAYRVVGPNVVADTAPGGIVDLALTKGQEKALLESGNLERADEADAGPDLLALKREELNEVAAERGVEEPEKLPNKEAVVKAIEEVAASPADGEEEVSG